MVVAQQALFAKFSGTYLTFNLSKCELVQVTNKKHPMEHSYYLQGEQIKSVPHTKYLGVIIDEHLMST